MVYLGVNILFYGNWALLAWLLIDTAYSQMLHPFPEQKLESSQCYDIILFKNINGASYSLSTCEMELTLFIYSDIHLFPKFVYGSRD